MQTSKGGKPLKAKKATPSVDFDLAETSTKVDVHTDKSVDMDTNVQIAQGTIPSSSVITNNSYFYSIGSSLICAREVEKSLSVYPFWNVKTELIQGLKHGFKLQYNGSRLPVQPKNSRSISENPYLVREKIFKEIDLGRVVGPFDYPPMPKTGNKDILRYLDDFLFGAEADSPKCYFTLQTFRDICKLCSRR